MSSFYRDSHFEDFLGKVGGLIPLNEKNRRAGRTTEECSSVGRGTCDDKFDFFARGLCFAEEDKQEFQRGAAVEHLAALSIFADEDAALGVGGHVARVDQYTGVTFHAEKTREDTAEARGARLHVDAIRAGGSHPSL